MVAARAAQLLVTGIREVAKNPLVWGTVVSKVSEALVKKLPELYRARSPIIAVTGLAGTGKTVLVHQLCSPKSDYVPLPYPSVVVEKKSRRSGMYGMRFRIVPGGEAVRWKGLEQLFHDEPVDGVIHVVADGLATVRPDSPDTLPDGLELDAYRALQREREVEDFRDTASHIVSLVTGSTRPVWLLIAVTKTDLLHPDIAAEIVGNYYSLGGHSPFATELRNLVRTVGDGNLTTAAMPVYAMAKDFEFRGETIPTRGTPQDRDARLEQFLHRVQHLVGQVS